MPEGSRGGHLSTVLWPHPAPALCSLGQSCSAIGNTYGCGSNGTHDTGIGQEDL